MGARSKIGVELNADVIQVTETHWGAPLHQNGYELRHGYRTFDEALALARLPRLSGSVLPYASAVKTREHFEAYMEVQDIAQGRVPDMELLREQDASQVIDASEFLCEDCYNDNEEWNGYYETVFLFRNGEWFFVETQNVTKVPGTELYTCEWQRLADDERAQSRDYYTAYDEDPDYNPYGESTERFKAEIAGRTLQVIA